MDIKEYKKQRKLVAKAQTELAHNKLGGYRLLTICLLVLALVFWRLYMAKKKKTYS